MIKPDIIISWPNNYDYPLWRQFVRDNRDKFSKIIVAFTQSFLGENYIEFIKKVMLDDIIFLDTAPKSGQDWRDAAVNIALEYSDAEWVWFTEQDFIIKKGFWENIDKILEENKKTLIIAAYENIRMHPCCIFAQRFAINQTRMDFGIVPNELDHFGVFQQDIENKQFLTAKIDPKTYNHLAGLSHNMRLVYDGVSPNHNPEEFKEYMKACFEVKVPLDPRFESLFQRIINVPKENKEAIGERSTSLKKTVGESIG